jgi:hypothetical protein
MSAVDPLRSPKSLVKVRRDGWTPERQLRFLDELASTHSVVKAAAFAGMSRESAYRLRHRSAGTLFALLWDRVLAFEPAPREVHAAPLTTGRLMRLLGTGFRRKRGHFVAIGAKRAAPSRP